MCVCVYNKKMCVYICVYICEVILINILVPQLGPQTKIHGSTLSGLQFRLNKRQKAVRFSGLQFRLNK